MFARVSTFNGPAAAIDSLVAQAENKVMPAASQLDGFRGMLLLGDRASGKSVSITLWDTQQAMGTSEQSADDLRAQSAATSGVQIVGVERLEVLLNRQR